MLKLKDYEIATKKLFKDLPRKSFEIVFKDKDIKERIYFGGDNLIKNGFPNKKCIVNSKARFTASSSLLKKLAMPALDP